MRALARKMEAHIYCLLACLRKNIPTKPLVLTYTPSLVYLFLIIIHQPRQLPILPLAHRDMSHMIPLPIEDLKPPDLKKKPPFISPYHPGHSPNPPKKHIPDQQSTHSPHSQPKPAHAPPSNHPSQISKTHHRPHPPT